MTSTIANLGRVGAWLGTRAFDSLADELRAAAELERLGYGAIWNGEAPHGREAMSRSALLLGATQRIVVATGIASIWARAPYAAAGGAATLDEAHPGRFVLTLGVSHRRLVDPTGQRYARPLTAMRDYLAELDELDLHSRAPQRPPRLIGALAPKMLELARDAADGAHPYLVTAEHTRRAREILGSDRFLAPELGFVLASAPDVARSLARRHLEFYLSTENYLASWRRLGFADEDFVGGGSDRLVDALIAWGDEEAVIARIDEHLDAGADHVAMQAIGGNPLSEYRQLAAALDLAPPKVR
jgi:probable F420-dependent oxidoreductase